MTLEFSDILPEKETPKSGGIICPACGGQGKYLAGNRELGWVPCEGCGATGWARAPMRSLAEVTAKVKTGSADAEDMAVVVHHLRQGRTQAQAVQAIKKERATSTKAPKQSVSGETPATETNAGFLDSFLSTPEKD